METQQNNVLYRNGTTQVTNDRVKVGDRSFPLSEVETTSITRPILKRSYGIVALGIGLVLTIVGYIVWNGVLLSPMVGGIALIVIGIALMIAARDAYLVRLNGANGNLAQIEVADQAQAQRLIDVIATNKVRPEPMMEREIGR